MARLGFMQPAASRCRPLMAERAAFMDSRPVVHARQCSQVQQACIVQTLAARHHRVGTRSHRNWARPKQTRVCAEKAPSPAPFAREGFPQGFDVALAVALAGCSFEAYLVPEGKDVLKTETTNGTVTTFTNREFLIENYSGMLQVQLKSASGLPARDFLGKSDPYAVLSVGESCAKSQVVYQNLNPEWNETFLLCVKDIDRDVLRMRLFDEDVLKSDDELGVAMYPVRALIDSKFHDLDLDLQGGGGGGKLKLSLRYLPFADNDSLEAFMDFDDEDLDSVTPVDIDPNEVMDPEDLEEALDSSIGMPEAWKELAMMAGRRAEERFDPVCYLDNKETDTQAWIYWSDRQFDRKEAVVAFRGTEQVSWKDLATDANLQPAALDVERTDAFKKLTGRLFKQASNELQAHKGFLDAYDSVKASVFGIIDAMTGGSPEWKLYITGHSLGGALATLCAFELATRNNTGPKVEMYNYGSPRVGNKAFALAFNAAVSKSWRVTNRKDVVATVPRLMGYTHVDRHVILNRDGSLVFDKPPRKDVLEGRVIKEMVDEVAEKAEDTQEMEDIAKIATDVLDPIMNHDMEVLADLMDGSGLAEHMEDLYLSGLRECIRSQD